MSDNEKKLTDAFLKNEQCVELGESEWVELDNLDEAKLVFKEGSKTQIEVENEHGTRFDTKELTKAEVDVFLFTLNN